MLLLSRRRKATLKSFFLFLLPICASVVFSILTMVLDNCLCLDNYDVYDLFFIVDRDIYMRRCIVSYPIVVVVDDDDVEIRLVL